MAVSVGSRVQCAYLLLSRAILMTIGQLCFYDQIKQTLLATPYFEDNLITHFSASLGAVRTRLAEDVQLCQDD